MFMSQGWLLVKMVVITRQWENMGWCGYALIPVQTSHQTLEAHQADYKVQARLVEIEGIVLNGLGNGMWK
jgi:hypothetical protein